MKKQIQTIALTTALSGIVTLGFSGSTYAVYECGTYSSGSYNTDEGCQTTSSSSSYTKSSPSGSSSSSPTTTTTASDPDTMSDSDTSTSTTTTKSDDTDTDTATAAADVKTEEVQTVDLLSTLKWPLITIGGLTAAGAGFWLLLIAKRRHNSSDSGL